MTRYVDLHMHTTGSDGEKTPTEMVDYACSQDIYFMSITDHDSVSGVSEGQRRAKELGIDFITGIELSCYDKKDTHILGYDIDITSPKLVAAINHLKEERMARSKKMVQKLQQGGFEIEESELDQYNKDGVIGRPHIAQILIDHGYGKDQREIFNKYLGATAPYYVSYDKLSIKAGFDAIKSAGGLIVIAHPKLLHYNNYDMYQLLKRYKAMGLNGLEVYYPYHTDKDIKAYTQMAQELNLLITFGSDYHNSHDKSKSKLGYPDHYRHIRETIEKLREHREKNTGS